MDLPHRPIAGLVLGLAAGASVLAGAQTGTDVQRRVYVSATDPRGAYVTDLTAADLAVNEGGKARQVSDVQPSTARLEIAVAIDELLASDTAVRQAAFQFVRQIHESGDMALYLVGRRNEKRVDYTTELGPFATAINAFPVRPQYPGSLVESLYEIARDQRALEGRRVIVALAPEMPQPSSVTADGVFSLFRDNGTVFYAVTIEGLTAAAVTLQATPTTRLEGGDLTAQVERDRVLNDGPKQSGGLRLPSSHTEGFAAALDRVADDLRHQYVVRYVIPTGSKSDGRLSIATKRKGVTVRGPKQLPPL